MPTPDFILETRKHIGHALMFLTGVTAVVVDPGGRILLHRRADDGHWATPGGILEPGEQPAAALVREVFEETGVRVVPERVASVVTEPPFTYPNGDRVQFMDIAFRCRPVGGEPRADGDESLDVAWFDPGGLPEMNDRILRRIRHAGEEGPAHFAAPE
ncbi:8-oxo-dGTP pyrophosphatase MutT (NUDIX family) [Spinactinospora alkalitolerans]|uniref:8-oxo-dGTP pyrophosphatase MutT (NUDIX family) n=1 Tax=Spinactinospora alkalitolerans TaxID=687207 RepID=A0A852TQF1_9ACTN|nr:NUDIX domain-containing protein [Spinactinospora alkalitolerans]NYE45052.1 8-oxo-dGTP pyrophosphatase MutT (NUDIX family) [Spinactinospora alkalitolerans]